MKVQYFYFLQLCGAILVLSKICLCFVPARAPYCRSWYCDPCLTSRLVVVKIELVWHPELTSVTNTTTTTTPTNV